MRRISIVAVIAICVLALVGQFVAPRIAAGKIEDRLTKAGGTAHAEVKALPWPRLLFTEGDSIRVEAKGIALPLTSPNAPVLKELDGFNKVDIQVTDATAGPMQIQSLTLKRDKGPYEVSIQGSVSPSDVSAFVTGFSLPFGTQPVPIDLQAVLRSDDGRPRAGTARGRVAGFPAGPLGEAVAQALAGRF